MRAFVRKMLVLLLPATMALSALGQEQIPSASAAYAVRQSQSALDRGDVTKALVLINESLQRFPGDESLRLQLARVYLRQHRDGKARQLLEDVFRNDPSNRRAKIELAQVLGYHGDLKRSDQLYRQILAEDANDESAAVGLVRNLIHEGHRDEARQAVQRALERHPNSLALLQYSDYLDDSKTISVETNRKDTGEIEAGASYFSDTAGNRSLRSFQASQYRVNRFVLGQSRIEERSLWKSAVTGRAIVSSAGEDVRLRLSKFFSVTANGGAVRFADGRSRSLYAGDVDLHPWRALALFGGYSRFPICPTFDSAQFDLLGQGWHGGVNLHSRNFSLSGGYAGSHYSDGNRSERESAEVIRWIGTPAFAFGTGYSFTHLHFTEALDHGYFDPGEYRSHLAEAGFRFRIKKFFRAEYLGRAGIESAARGTYSPAGEVFLKNHFLLKQWDLALNYSRYQIAQSTGAFQANSVSVSLGYGF